MEHPDHVDWAELDIQRDNERADAILAIMNPYAPLGTPAEPVKPAQRYRLRFCVMECCECGYAKEFCRGHVAPVASEAQDGAAAASLQRRVDACKGK